MNDSRSGPVLNESLESAIQALHRKGVRFWVENGALRYRAPKGVISGDDIAVLQDLDSRRPSSPVARRGDSHFQPFLAGDVRSKCAPLSFNQLVHWQLRGMTGYRPARQVTSVTRIRGNLHASAMKEALDVVTERHDALRTHILNRNGELMQEVAEQSNNNLHVLDMADIPSHERDKEVRRQITSAILDVSDYYVDPLFKPMLLKLEEAENVLILAMDHMVSDGASSSILETEIFTAYEQLVNGREVSLPIVQMQYADYAIWQRTTLADYLKNQEGTWRAWRRTEFPADAREREQGELGWGHVLFTLDLRLRRALEEWARRRGTTLVMVVLTAYVAFVMRWCEMFDTVIQVTSNGRTSRMIENTIGYVAYPLYLHVSACENATFTDLLEAVTAAYCQACERPNYYYSYTLSPRPEFTRNTCFNWIPRSRGLGHDDSADMKNLNSRSRVIYDDPILDTLNYDAEPSIGFVDTGGEISGSVAFPRRRFTSSTMERFVRAFHLLLDGIAARPTVDIRELMTT